MKTKKNIAFRLFILTSISLLFTACGNTKLVENWNDPNFQGPPLKKILVIGMIKNEERRRMFEDIFSKAITTDKRSGIISYTLLPDLKPSKNKEKILKAVEKTGADGVLIVTSHGVHQQDRVTKGTVDYIPNSGLGYGLYGYYNMSNSFIYTQGVEISESLLNVDAKLFKISTEKMIWSGKTETFEPSSADKVINEFKKVIINDMSKKGVI